MKDEPRVNARVWAGVAALAAGLGVALRTRALLANRSLWLDEAMLALNVCRRGFPELLKPLDYDQGAPVGFLVLERLAVIALGANELSLRLAPYLASLATLALVYRFCRTNLDARGAAVGLLLAAVTPGLISYAGEAKQYSVDVAVGLLVLTLASDALRQGLSGRRAVVLALVGALAVWLSHPAAFVLAGAGTTLILKEALRRRTVPALFALGASACWFASFVALYALSLRDLQSNSYLNTFWESGFLSLPPRSMNDIRQYVVVALGVFEAPFQNTQLDESLSERMSLIAAAGWLLGVFVLARRGDRGLLCLLVAPLGFAVLAAVLHLYPLRFRLALFTAGPTLLASAAGLAFLLRAQEGSSRVVARVLFVCLLVLPGMQAAQFLIQRPQPYGARAVLKQVAAEWRPGDLLLVDGGSEPPFRWYQSYGHIDGLDRIPARNCVEGIADPAKLVSELPALRGEARVWMLVSAHLPDRSGREAQLLRLTLDQWGERLQSVNAKGYYAYLYDFKNPMVSLGRRPVASRE